MSEVNINDLTLGQVEKISKLAGCGGSVDSSPLGVRKGMKIFIWNVTRAYLGEVVDFTAKEIAIKRASWVADTRRYGEFLAKGVASGQPEIEVFPPELVVYVSRGANDLYLEWEHELPTETQ